MRQPRIRPTQQESTFGFFRQVLSTRTNCAARLANVILTKHKAELVYLDFPDAKTKVDLSPAIGRYNQPVDKQIESENGIDKP
jgi:hypothetical protein